MHCVLTNLMAGLLFIHTVFGCCWHHAHSYAQTEQTAVRKSASCCQHHEYSSDSKHENAPCQGKLECHGTCTYVVPQKVQIDGPDAAVSFDFAAIVATTADSLIASETPRGLVLWPDAFQPPLR